MFTGIDYIDASALNEKDDILGSVLSKMLTKWNKEEWRSNTGSGIVRGKDYEHKKRKLRMQFNNVYERLKDLRSTKDVMEKDSDMFLETLEHLSLSWNVKSSFQNLVEAYLDIMVYPNSEKDISTDNHFLVIPIDDLDMNINHGFMLLEQIRKYLMLPNVIVLLSANYEQLEKICCNHYKKEFKDLDKNDDNNNYILKLAKEYLEKMVPKQNQINLSSGWNWKYFTEDRIRINYLQFEDRQEDDSEKVVSYEGTLCEIISSQMRQCFRTTFMHNGICIKYLTPNTLRELVSWIIQFSHLQNKFEDSDDSLEAYRKNIKHFWEVEFQNLCGKNLSLEKQKIIKMLDMLEPEQQIDIIIKNLSLEKQKNIKVSDMLESERQMNIIRKKLGRNDVKERESFFKVLSVANKKDNEMQKLVVICLIYITMKLATYGMPLEDSIQREKKYKQQGNKELEEKEREYRKNIYKMFLKYYTADEWGIWGNWERQILSPILENNAEGESFKYINTTFICKEQCLSLELQGSFEINNQKSVESFLNVNAKQIKDFQYLLLFYYLEIKTTDKYIWKLDSEESTQTQSIFKPIREFKGNFSFCGFTLNLLEGASLLDNFLNSLLHAMLPQRKDYKTFGALNRLSILKELKEQEYLLGLPLLPIDNLEFILNLGEKLQKEFEDIGIEDDIKSLTFKYFEKLQEYLSEYDNTENRAMLTRFQKFPLVQKILNSEDSIWSIIEKNINCHMETDDMFGNEDEEWTQEN